MSEHTLTGYDFDDAEEYYEYLSNIPNNVSARPTGAVYYMNVGRGRNTDASASGGGKRGRSPDGNEREMRGECEETVVLKSIRDKFNLFVTDGDKRKYKNFLLFVIKGNGTVCLRII